MAEWTLVKKQKPPEGKVVYLTIQGHDLISPEPGETLTDAYLRVRNTRWVTEGFWVEDEGWCEAMFGGPLMVSPIAWMPKPDRPEPYGGEV